MNVLAALRRRIIYHPCPKLIDIHINLSFRNLEIVEERRNLLPDLLGK